MSQWLTLSPEKIIREEYRMNSKPLLYLGSLVPIVFFGTTFIAGLELLRGSSGGILPAIASASRASGRARRPPDSRRDGGATN